MTDRLHNALDKGKLFRRINAGLLVGLGIFLLFDKVSLGVGVIFSLTGMLSLIACYFNIDPLMLSIGGFDYGMKLLLKEFYNRYANLFWGIIQLIVGICCLYEVFFKS